MRNTKKNIAGITPKFGSHERKFLLYSIGAIFTSLIIYQFWRSGLVGLNPIPDGTSEITSNSEANAAWITGIFAACVGFIGAWVAINIAQVATDAQIETTKFEDPFYHQAVSIIASAKNVEAALCMIMQGYENSVSISNIGGKPDYRPLISALSQAKSLLEKNLIDSNLFNYLISASGHKQEKISSIIINIFTSFENMIASMDRDDVAINNSFRSFIYSFIAFIYIIEEMDKIPSIDDLRSQLKNAEYKLSDSGKSIKVNTDLKKSLFRFYRKVSAHAAKSTGLLTYNLLESQDYSDHAKMLVRQFLWRDYCVKNESSMRELDVQIKLNGLIGADDYHLKSQIKAIYRNLNSGVDIKERENNPPKRKPSIISDIIELPCAKSVAREIIYNAFAFQDNKVDICEVFTLEDLRGYGVPQADLNHLHLAESRASDKEFQPLSLEHKDYLERQQKILKNRTLARECVQRVAKSLNDSGKLFLIWLDDDDFYTKMHLANYLPWSILIWHGYPYFPCPGRLEVVSFITEGKVSFIDSKSSDPYATRKSVAPLLITGSHSLNEKLSKMSSDDGADTIAEKSRAEVAIAEGLRGVVPNCLFI